MESRRDSENAERILYNMSPLQLVEVAKQAYYQVALDDGVVQAEGVSANDLEDVHSESISDNDHTNIENGKEKTLPRDVGHNIYILAHQVCKIFNLLIYFI